MKYTHKDVEGDRYKPVGSLFMSLMDRDSLPPRGHVHREYRGMYNRSLPNTPFSLYPDEPARAQTPSSGRRHFPDMAVSQYIWQSSAPASLDGGGGVTGMGAGVAHRNRPDHLGSNMVPRQAEATPVRQKRYVREPRGTGLDDTPIRIRLAWGGGGDDTGADLGSNTGARRYGSVVRTRAAPACSQARDHLGVHTLIPRAEPEKERPVPPPMVKAPRKTGIRMLPDRRSASAADHRTGVKRVVPPPHWRSTNDRQWDFLELGVSAHDSPRTRYRNQSSAAIAGGAGSPSQGRTRTASASSAAGSRSGAGASQSQTQRWRGRRSSASAQRRDYDIITGRPLAH